MIDKDLEAIRAEGQLAVGDPEAYVLSNPTPRDWTLTAQEIAQSVKLDPRKMAMLRKTDFEPETLNIAETLGQGVWDALTDGSMLSSIQTSLASWSSPDMTQEEADRLMQDVLYTRSYTRKAKDISNAQKITHEDWYDFANGVGSFIKYALLGGITGSPAAIGMFAGAEAGSQLEADLVDRYIEKTGDIKGYTARERNIDLGLSGAYGVFNGAVESMLGVERVATGAVRSRINKELTSRLIGASRSTGKSAREIMMRLEDLQVQMGRKFSQKAWQNARRILTSAGEEGLEEAIQSLGEDLTTAIAGYSDDFTASGVLGKAATNAMYGAIIGGPAGWGLYRYNRKTFIDRLNKWNKDRNVGLKDNEVVEFADKILDEGKSRMFDEIATRAEIKSHYGQAYDLVKKRISDVIDATGTTPWQDKTKTKEEYVQVLADSITWPSISVANQLNIPLSEFLEIADIESWVVGNTVGFKPITSIEDIDEIIRQQKLIIKEQRANKKLGVDNEDALNTAKQRLAIAERVRLELIQEQNIIQERTTRRKENADYITAKGLQPDHVKTLDNATQATADQDFVLFAGKRIPVEYQVVELDSVQPSHINGTPNPNYTNKALQNRASRGTTQDVADLRGKASPENFTPERLMKATTSAEGSPVVNAKNEVIAGNGRTEIVRYAYENPQTAEQYKQELQKQGFNIDGMNKPMLVRKNTTLNDQEQVAAADISNISETSAFDEASQARRDTQYLKDSPTAIDFASKLPMSEKRGLMLNNGKWNKRKVQQRYEDALLAWLCGNDTTLFENLVLDRKLSQKVIDTLTANGTLLYETATKYPELELREDIYHALVKMQNATRDNFIELTQQLELDGHDVMPENIMVWNWLFTDASTNRQFMNSYATILANNHESVEAGQDMFGQKVAPLSKKDALIQALKKADQAKAETAMARGREYEPLFNEENVATDVNLAAAIISYNNQFAPTNNLNQAQLQQFDLADENARLDDIYPAYDGETIEVDGKERTVYNSNGDRIAKSKEALTNFWRWFGDSKVVDEQGRPLVVYHGTERGGFDTFSEDEIGSNTKNAEAGFFFGDKRIARTYSGTDKTITREQIKEFNEDSENGFEPDYIRGLYPVYLKMTDDVAIYDFRDASWDGKAYGKYALKNEEEYDWVRDESGEVILFDSIEELQNYVDSHPEAEEYTQWDDPQIEESTRDLAVLEKENGASGVIIKNVDDAGRHSYGGEVGNVYIVFNSNQIKSVENRGTYSSDTGNIYYQKHGIVTWQKTPVKERLYSIDWLKPRKFVVTHNINIDKLNKAIELGGLPSPSIAISRADAPANLEDFGGIKLIGTPDMINPADQQNAVFDRDVWSQTFPTPTYSNATVEAGKRFENKFKASFEKAGDNNLGTIINFAVNSFDPRQAISYFELSNGTQLYYIENVLGKKVNIPMQDRYSLVELPYLKPDQQFLDEVLKIKDTDNEPYTVWGEQFKKAVNGLLNRGGVDTKWKETQDPQKTLQHIRDFYNNAIKEFQAASMIKSVKNYVENNEKIIDTNELTLQLMRDYDLQNNSKYITWARKQIESIIGEPKLKIGNKLYDWNLENILKAMTQDAIVGSEKIATSKGKVIAAGAKQFSSIEEIRKAGKQLVSRETEKAKAGNKVERFGELVLDFVGEDNRETVYQSMMKMVKLKNPTQSDIQRILSQALGKEVNLDHNLLQLGVDMAKEVKDIHRSYFEAKPQRIVNFNEFAGAIVPTDNVYNESADKLAEIGLNVIRSDNLKEGIDALAAQGEDFLFQKRGIVRGFYDPELLTITLTKYWNETTFVHEQHHRFLDKLFGYYKQIQTGERVAPDAFIQSMDQLFQMLDIDPAQDQLSVVQQEKFATMVEAYLTGLGVDNPDNLAFKTFLHWIPEQYKSILDLGYLDENNEIQNPILDQQSITWFNKWFANPFAPSLATSPEAQKLVNPTDENGEIVPSKQKVMNDREKDWGQDSEQQQKADAQLWRAMGENTPTNIRAALDGEKERMKAEANNQPDDTKLPEEHKPTIREKWFRPRQKDAREIAATKAREYLAQNPEHARQLAFADPETMTEFDAPVDQGMLIRAVMETVPHGSDEWYILNDNLATVKSMSGSTLSLSGDQSHQAYLDAKREVEAARELKAAINYAGTRRGAIDKWNSDIRAFIAKNTTTILATEPNSEERKTAIKAFLEEAKTKFSANTTNAILNQMDLTGLQTKNSQAFIKWAEKQIKQATHAKIDTAEQKELMKASIAAQLALKEIDSTIQKDGLFVRATQAAKDIRHWQFVKDKIKKAYIGRWGKFGIFWDNLFGSYAPSAMLMSVNTLFFANVPSTALNSRTIKMAAAIIGKNNVDKAVTDAEEERIRQVFNASGVNLAQMDKPTSPSTLHGEKYMNTEQKHWYNFTFEILGRTDNVFRIPRFVDALARIATKNADGDKAKATTLFKEYAKLNNQSDEAKIARKQALAVANMAVFTQDGMMASALNHIRSALNTITRVPLGLDPQGFGLGNILAPFLKTGANITEMGLSATFAPIKTIAMGFQKLQGKEIPDIKKMTLVSDWINLAYTCVAVAVLASISGDDEDWYEEPYQSGRKYDPNKPYDSIRFGNTWVKLDIFGPMAIPLRTAAMLVKDWETDKLQAISDGMFEALSDTPLVQSFTDSNLDYMTRQPEKYWSSFAYNQANKLVPAQVKSATRAVSRGTGATWNTDWLGQTINRKFHRNYGLDSTRLTTNDLINVLTNRIKVGND